METSLLREKLIHKEIDIDEYYSELFKKIEETKDLNIFITFDKDFVLEQINVLKEKLEKNETPGRLFGIPITIKDNILTEGLRTTCASKALEDYMPVYNATVIERLKSEDAVIIGKTNMDEFAMGGASETSYFGPTKNPLDPKLIPGGSSSGSAASVSTGLVNISLGSDTGGSIRQPSAFCNVTGFLPSYGSVSRYGVASMANTLDQVGVVGKSVEDIVTTLNIIGGHDSKDMTSSQKESLDLQLKEEYTLKGKKIGVIDTEAFPIHKTVVEDYNTAIERLKSLGAEIVPIDFKYIKYSTPLYNVIMSCEVSSNLSRFDGIRYGYLAQDYSTTRELFVKTRSQEFGEEVQRRIAMGTHYLAAENDQAIYKQGLKVRRLLQEEFEEKFKEVDFIATPTSTDLPYELGARAGDPLADYDDGTFDVPVNLAGLCAISLPVREGISGALQIIGNRRDDENVLNAAYCFEGGK